MSSDRCDVSPDNLLILGQCDGVGLPEGGRYPACGPTTRMNTRTGFPGTVPQPVVRVSVGIPPYHLGCTSHPCNPSSCERV